MAEVDMSNSMAEASVEEMKEEAPSGLSESGSESNDNVNVDVNNSAKNSANTNHNEHANQSETSSAANEFQKAAERISNDIASTLNSLGATFLSSGSVGTATTSSSTQMTAKGQSKGFIESCWIVPDEPDTNIQIAEDAAIFHDKTVPGIKGKLQLDETSVQNSTQEGATPLQRLRHEQGHGSKAAAAATGERPEEGPESPLTPSRRSQGEVLESWRRKMKIAQKQKEQEDMTLGTGDDHTQTTTDEHSFIRNEDDTVFREDNDDHNNNNNNNDDNHSHLIQACRPKNDDNGAGGGMLDPIFSAAMTLSEIPNSRKDFMDLVVGKCRVMIGVDDEASTDSEETDEWSDGYDSHMTPDSPHHNRHNRRNGGNGRRNRSARHRKSNRSRRTRSVDSDRRRGGGSPSKSPKRRSKSRKNYPPPLDDASSYIQSEITMTPDRNKEYSSSSQQPISPPRRSHQRTPPTSDHLMAAVTAGVPGAGATMTPNTVASKTRYDNVTPSRSRSKSPEKRRPGVMKTSPTYSTPNENKRSSSNNNNKSPRSTAPKSPAANTDPKDKNFIKVFINDITNKGYRMMWYKDRSSSTPSTVVLFLQHGKKSPTNGSYSGPAMVWLDESEQNQFFGVNLFDIRTLDRATMATLGAQSFAMPSRSVFLRLAKGNEFIFEAPTEQDAFRFVHGMKWVIARLAFNLVIGNMDVVCELVKVEKGEAVEKGRQQQQQHNQGNNGKGSHKRRGMGERDEATTAQAMDDVTLQMVDKSILKIV